ncbi:RraA family protein [Providencia huaxiensis]|uniref:RraA family protein n=1 Tax=Providencia TaxID=586 RepID=UPI001EFD7DD2|nr:MULTISPECIES: RraA family protein [Providencia]MCG9536178.1 RraA family protein [Providencia huaxiensis]
MNKDNDLFNKIKKELPVALLGDILDEIGLHHQFLPPILKPLTEDMKIVGRAMPVLEADYMLPPDVTSNGPLGNQDFGIMFEALDNLKEGEVYIASGSSHNYALWGGLMTTRAKKLNAAGAIIYGYSRDKREILELDFPVFSLGSYAQDQKIRGKVLDYRVPIKINNILIEPGDLIVADEEGVLIIPKSVESYVIENAFEKQKMENKVQKEIANGMGAVEAYNKFGVM